MNVQICQLVSIFLCRKCSSTISYDLHPLPDKVIHADEDLRYLALIPSKACVDLSRTTNAFTLSSGKICSHTPLLQEAE